MKNVTQVLKQLYLEAPDKVSVHLLFSRQSDQAITYRELLHGSARYAQALKQAEIRPGEVVILTLDHGEDLLTAFWGVILNGSIPSILPFLTDKLSPEIYRKSLAALFGITAPTAVITDPDFMGEVQKASKWTSVRAIISSVEVQNRISDINEVNFDQLRGLTSPPEDIVLLQHSSGTTGLQKGVALSHQAVFNQLESYSRALDLNHNDVIVSWLPLYHDMGLIAGFLLPILKRIPLVLMSPFDWVRAPYRLLQAISSYRGTLCWMPNFAYNFMAQKTRHRDLEGVDLSSLRAVINCSEPMYWKSHKMFLDHFQAYGLRSDALATSYAMAENVFAVTQGGINSPVKLDVIDQDAFLSRQTAEPVGETHERENLWMQSDLTENPSVLNMLSAGQPIEDTNVRILDQQGVDLPERHVGEIALQSNCMLTGYYHRPDLTQKALLEGWYMTGDLGYLANGELYVTGRKKDLIIVGGKNIYPQDLEYLASEVEGIHAGRVAAFGVFNERTGTEDVVIVAEVDHDRLEARQPGSSDIQDQTERIAAEIRERVTRGSDIALRYVHVVDRNWLLKTSSGKVARRANREKYLSEFSGV